VDATVVEAESRGPRVAALELTTPIFNVPEWPPKDPSKATEDRAGAVRLGYLRFGQTVDVKPDVLKKSNCAEGWYELVSGGYVCGKFVTANLSAKELGRAPHVPYTDRPLPYDYGLNITNGTPLYRRRPLRKERKELEQGLAVGKKRRGKKEEAAEEGSATADSPWYLRDQKGQRPQVKIDDIRTNEQGGLVVLRMVKGFYLSLDTSVMTGAGKFWKSTSGHWAPADHVLVHKSSTEFEGVSLSQDASGKHLPLGWVVSPRAHKYAIDRSDAEPVKRQGASVKKGESVSRFTLMQLTGKSVTIEGRGYFETDEGWWLRDSDAAVTRPSAPPKNLAAGEKWIDVNISTQSLVAFEGTKPVYATIVLTGKKEHKTVTGEFRIREKHIAATMEDDTASDGPYSIQDVPWIMYFEGSYALHGAFWHSMFGRERSHGCVNLTPFDAKHLFHWSTPTLPQGWHGVKATKENAGTRVIVHEG